MVISIERLQEIFKNAFSSEVEINYETTKENTPEWDSINHLNLIVELEDSLNIQFHSEEIESIKSVKKLLELIQKKSNV